MVALLYNHATAKYAENMETPLVFTEGRPWTLTESNKTPGVRVASPTMIGQYLTS
jgi:hypothetical protein